MGIFPTQNIQSEAVESRYAQRGCDLGVHEGADALAHLPGGLVGKRDRRYVIRRVAAAGDKAGDLVGNDPGLAAAGSRQHQERTFQVVHGALLFGVERHPWAGVIQGPEGVRDPRRKGFIGGGRGRNYTRMTGADKRSSRRCRGGHPVPIWPDDGVSF